MTRDELIEKIAIKVGEVIGVDVTHGYTRAHLISEIALDVVQENAKVLVPLTPTMQADEHNLWRDEGGDVRYIELNTQTDEGGE